MRRYILLALTGLVALLSTTAQADNFSIIINGMSKHFPSHPLYNEQNSGYGFQYEKVARQGRRLIAGVGQFIDSYHSRAAYLSVGHSWRLWRRGRGANALYIDAGGVVLAARSEAYEYYYRTRVLIAPLPMLSLGWGKAGVNMMFVPKVAGSYSTVLTVQAKLTIL